jgi:hypothetical protein
MLGIVHAINVSIVPNGLLFVDHEGLVHALIINERQFPHVLKFEINVAWKFVASIDSWQPTKDSIGRFQEGERPNFYEVCSNVVNI